MGKNRVGRIHNFQDPCASSQVHLLINYFVAVWYVKSSKQLL